MSSSLCLLIVFKFAICILLFFAVAGKMQLNQMGKMFITTKIQENLIYNHGELERQRERGSEKTS